MNSNIAIVAGAGAVGGLGHATALALHTAGFTVVAVDRNEGGLAALPTEIHRETADATDPMETGPLIDRIAAQIGPPAVLVNTIGTYELGDALTVTPDILHKMIDVNLGPALWLTQAVAPHMHKLGGGAIVHVTARPGIEPSAGTAAYSISKAGLAHLVRILDIELRPSGIRVNALAPQIIATARNKELFPEGALAAAVEPSALAETIAFLVSDAAESISGAVVPAYGG